MKAHHITFVAAGGLVQVRMPGHLEETIMRRLALAYVDQGRTWILGRFTERSEQGQALLAAWALLSEPQERGPTGVIGPIGPGGPIGATGLLGATGPLGSTGPSGVGVMRTSGPIVHGQMVTASLGSAAMRVQEQMAALGFLGSAVPPRLKNP